MTMMKVLLAAALPAARVSAAVGSAGGTASTPTTSTRKYTVAVDWAAPPAATASTAATVEVDCCEPFLTRDPAAHLNGGGSFSDYTLAMRDLGADFVRWASWYVYPRVVVLELEPPDCTATQPATNFNSEHFDAVTADFMQTVCGPQAALGKCEHSVAIQIATSPSWVWNDGTDPKTLPKNPWEYESGNMGAYNKGTTLVDETCKPLAEYVGRVVAHYTAGGHNDSCGHWHPSGLHYNWSFISFYNENEHNMGGPRYTRCWDQLRPLIEKISPGSVLEGPESVMATWRPSENPTDYLSYFIDPKNHADQRAPELLTFHWYAGSAGTPQEYNDAISAIDKYIDDHVKPLVALRDKVAPKTGMALDEYIWVLADWCDPDDAKRLFAEHDNLEADPLSGGGCPNWQDSRANGSAVGANRRTLGWSASAAHYAYGYAKLALQGFQSVGLDDLACGPWPDNEPAVTGMDWQTGEPMARFFVVRMLVASLGAGRKQLLVANVTEASPPTPAPGGCFAVKDRDYKFAPGNVFPATKTYPRGMRPVDTAAQCCDLCKSFKNCSFWTYENSGTAAKPLCYQYKQACCILKTEAASGKSKGSTGSISGSKNPPPVSPAVFVLPFVLEQPHAPYVAGQRGLLVVNKVDTPSELKLDGALHGAVATVLEGVGESPGYTEPRTTVIGPDLTLAIGPYAVATVMAAM